MPTLDSRKLLAFVVLTRTQSFTVAARQLHLTQSAVSHAIKSLEEELELKLFDRLGRTVQLTAAGQLLLGHAERILRDMHEARNDLSRFSAQLRRETVPQLARPPAG